MKLNVITRIVANLEASRRFYEDVLGFQPGPAYVPTRWQAYQAENGALYAIGEAPGSTDEISFEVPDIEALWAQVRDTADVVAPLEHTPWGTFRFVVRDPDGHLLAFGQQPPPE